jgi:hypothetical protein
VMCEISDFFGMMGGRHASLAQMKCTAGVLMSLGVTDFTSYYSVSVHPNQPADLTPKSRRFSVQEYRQYTDYVSRVNTFFGEGKRSARTAVLHPIVSVWANFTPPTRSMYEPHPSDRVRFIDDSFANLCRELLQHQIEYDIIDERSLEGARLDGKKLIVGDQEYDVLILPPMDTVRLRSLERMDQFVQHGGTVFAHPLHPQFAVEGPEKDREIVTMMERIHAKGGSAGAAQAETPLYYLIRSRVPPACHLAPSSTHIICTSVWRNGTPSFFLVNASSEAYSGKCAVLATGKPLLVDVITGLEQSVQYKKSGSSLEVDVVLPSYGSLFLAFG